MVDAAEAGHGLHSLSSPFQKALWTGHVQGVLRFLFSPAKEQLLLEREPQLNFPVLHLLVLGAQRFKGPPNVHNHLQSLQLLLRAGANVHARDCNGHTALHHAVLHHPRLDLAALLIKHGADVNARNRFGDTPLMGPVMQNDFETCKFLYDAGADPDLTNYEDTTPKGVAMEFPRIIALLERPRGESSQEAGPSDSEDEKPKAGEEQNKTKPEAHLEVLSCGGCGKALMPNLASRCAKCGSMTYCSRECQVSDWKTHKVTCRKKVNYEHEVEVTPVDIPEGASCMPHAEYSKQLSRMRSGENMSDELPSDNQKKNKKFLRRGGSFILKVQASLDRSMKANPKGALLAYNKGRIFECNIAPTDPGFKQVYDCITTRGVGGLKAYFNAYVNKDKKIMIVTQPMLAPQPW